MCLKPYRTQPSAIMLIDHERTRQLIAEGFSGAHDDEHTDHELASAAICYAAPFPIYRQDHGIDGFAFIDPWPETWDHAWDKRKRGAADAFLLDADDLSPAERIRNLVKAGALICAEIERMQRIQAAAERAKETLSNDGRVSLP